MTLIEFKARVARGSRFIVRLRAFWGMLLLVPSLVLLVQCGIRMFRYSKDGLDLSDEGLYFLSAETSKSAGIIGSWGNFTHLLLELSGNNLALFRFSGELLLAGVGGVLGASLAHVLFAPRSRSASAAIDGAPMEFPRWHIVGGAIIGVAMLPMYYALFLITPSYNWANLLGASMTIAMLVLWIRRPFSRSWNEPASWACTVLGVLISFVSRPGTAVALASAVVIVTVPRLVAARRQGWVELVKGMAIAAGAALVAALVFFAAVSSPAEIAESLHRIRVWTSASANETLKGFITGGWQELVALFRSAARPASHYLLYAAIPVLLSVGMRWLPRFFRHRLLVMACELGYLALFVVLVLNLREQGHLVGGPNIGVILPGAAVTGFYVAAGIWVSRRILAFAAGDAGVVDLPLAGFGTVVSVSVIVLGAMFAYAFTSNNGIAESATSSGLAWMLSALLVASALTWRVARAVGMAVLPLIFVLLIGWITNDGAASPYRTYSFSQDTASVTIPVDGRSSRLSVTPAQAEFVNGIQKAAGRAGFRAGTPLEDFTPGGGYVFTPGLVVILGGQAPTTLMPMFLTTPLSVSQWAVDLQPHSYRQHAWIAVSNVGEPLAVAVGLVAPHRKASQYELVYKGSWAPLGETVSLYRPRS